MHTIVDPVVQRRPAPHLRLHQRIKELPDEGSILHPDGDRGTGGGGVPAERRGNLCVVCVLLGEGGGGGGWGRVVGGDGGQ